MNCMKSNLATNWAMKSMKQSQQSSQNTAYENLMRSINQHYKNFARKQTRDNKYNDPDIQDETSPNNFYTQMISSSSFSNPSNNSIPNSVNDHSDNDNDGPQQAPVNDYDEQKCHQQQAARTQQQAQILALQHQAQQTGLPEHTLTQNKCIKRSTNYNNNQSHGLHPAPFETMMPFIPSPYHQNYANVNINIGQQPVSYDYPPPVGYSPAPVSNMAYPYPYHRTQEQNWAQPHYTYPGYIHDHDIYMMNPAGLPPPPPPPFNPHEQQFHFAQTQLQAIQDEWKMQRAEFKAMQENYHRFKNAKGYYHDNANVEYAQQGNGYDYGYGRYGYPQNHNGYQFDDGQIIDLAANETNTAGNNNGNVSGNNVAYAQYLHQMEHQ